MIRFLPLIALGLAGIASAQAPAGADFQAFADRARARLMALDIDHDGRLSKDEFAARRQGMGKRGGPGMAARPGAGAKMFDRFDTNRDGYLETAELDAMLARRFARMDANHDGRLTADERGAMRGGAAAEPQR